jgi:hypothetical protein
VAFRRNPHCATDAPAVSLDLIVIMDRRPSVDADTLAAYLRTLPAPIPGVIERYGKLWRPTEWTVGTSGVDGLPTVVGPGGFSIAIRARAVKMYHVIRFGTFTSDPDARDLLRRTCKTIAGFIDSPRALYTHELMPTEGADLESVAASLRANVGPPSVTFEALRAAEDFGPGAWYVDNFADLATRA